MTHWKSKAMIATTALLGLLGPAAAMKSTGAGKSPPNKQTQPNNTKATPPASRKSVQGMGRAPQELDKKPSPVRSVLDHVRIGASIE